MPGVKHVWFGQKAIFLGDDAADALVAYAAHVAQLRSGVITVTLGAALVVTALGILFKALETAAGIKQGGLHHS